MKKIHYLRKCITGITLLLLSFQIASAAANDLTVELHSLVNSAYTGPARYIVDSTIKQEGRRIEKSDETEVLQDGNMLRLTCTSGVIGFQKLTRKPSVAIVIDGKRAFLLSKNANAQSFQLLSVNPVQRDSGSVSLSDATIGMGTHDECIRAIGNWFSYWILKPALNKKQGFSFLELHKSDSGFTGVIKCDVGVLSAAGYGEELTFSFLSDSRGLVTHWEHAYSKEFPESRFTTDIAWDAEGSFMSLNQKLVEGTRIVTTWDSRVRNYSRKPIDLGEFSIEHFGLKSENPSVPVVGIFAGAVALFCVFLWVRRK